MNIGELRRKKAIYFQGAGKLVRIKTLRGAGSQQTLNKEQRAEENIFGNSGEI